MHSRRSFFGILTGLAALVPLPAFARSQEPYTGEFYQPTFDTDFLELPQDIHIYEWDQPMMLEDAEHMVRRIKIMVPGERLDIPVMFNLREVGSAVLQSQGAGKPPEWVQRPRRLIMSVFEVPEDELTASMATTMMSQGAGRDGEDHPVWVTLHQVGQPVRHMMTSTPYQLGVDDLLLTLPVGKGRTKVFREPPCPHDAGEDGPWRANPGLWEARRA